MTHKPIIPPGEVLQKLKEDWDFEALIEPYKDGGKPDMKVERTWGTMIDWLMNKRKFPPDVVGASIFLLWMRIKQDGHIPHDLDEKGRPIYGSAGRKFAHALAGICAGLMKEKISGNIFSDMANTIEGRVKAAFRNDIFSLMPWFVKMFSVHYWKHRSRMRKAKKNELANRV
jgi:hypothetical protein